MIVVDGKIVLLGNAIALLPDALNENYRIYGKQFAQYHLPGRVNVCAAGCSVTQISRSVTPSWRVKANKLVS